jgi:hypothetical protein
MFQNCPSMTSANMCTGCDCTCSGNYCDCS